MAGSIILAFVIYMIYIGIQVDIEGHPVSPLRHIGVFIIIFFVIYVLKKIRKSRRTRKEESIQEEKNKVMDYAKGSSTYASESYETTEYRSETSVWQQEPESPEFGATVTDSAPQPSPFLTNEEILQEAVAAYEKETSAQKEQSRSTDRLEALKRKTEQFFQILPGNRVISMILKILIIYMIASVAVRLLRIVMPSGAFASAYIELLLIISLFFVFRGTSPDRKAESKVFASAVYGRLVPREVAKVFPGAVYQRYGRMMLTDVEALNCFKRMFREEGSEDEPSRNFYLNIVRLETETGNQISGTYDGVPFTASYETIRGLYRTTKPQHGIEYAERPPGSFGSMRRDPKAEREETLFTGMVVRIPMRRSSAEPLGLVAASPAQVERELRNSRRASAAEECGNHRLRTESEEFNRLFHIYGLDDGNALFILTPDRMERLAAAYHGIYLTKEIDSHFKSMIVAFNQDTMYLGIECTEPLFFFYEKREDTASFWMSNAARAQILQKKMLTPETLAMIEQMAAEQAEMVRRGVECARRIASV